MSCLARAVVANILSLRKTVVRRVLHRGVDYSSGPVPAMAILGSDSSGQIEFRLAPAERLQEAIELQRNTMRQEPTAIGAGIWEDEGAAEEMQLIFQEVARNGLTVIAVDVETDRLAGVAFTRLHALSETGMEDHLSAMFNKLQHPSCLELIRFLEHVESKVDFYERYKVNGVMELFYLGTNPEYRARGIGTRLCEACLRLGKCLSTGEFPASDNEYRVSPEPRIAYGIFASAYSQRIAEKLGFESLAEVRYEDYQCRGKKMSERIGKHHEKAVVAAILL